MADYIRIGADNLVRVSSLRDIASGGDYENSATVTFTLKTLAGVNVTGQTWPATAAYVVGSDGNYEGVLEDGLSLIEGTDYALEVTADAGSDKIGFWRKIYRARYQPL